MTTQPDELLPYYHDYGSEKQKIGRRIYHAALSDRRGFRDDQIGIDSEDDVWLEIFEAIGESAIENTRPTPSIDDLVDVEALKRDFEGFLRHRAIDNSKTKDAWDREIYAHSHVQAMWEGFLYGRTAHYNLTRKGE